MTITDRMLAAALKKGVELGLLSVVDGTYIRQVLESALTAEDEECEARLNRARAAYDALRETLEIEHARALDAERERDAIIWAWPEVGLFAVWQYRDKWAARSGSGEIRTGFETKPDAVRFAAGLDATPAEGGGKP